ncbi:MAG: hypothetical protein JXC32_20635 [Anaerolineae bacterium]|nr:hypothetical protein [Anaerolineae bacterium]
MTTEELEIHPSRQRGSSQTIIEHGGGDERKLAAGYGRALFGLALVGVAWWLLVVPLLVGRGAAVALVAGGLWWALTRLHVERLTRAIYTGLVALSVGVAVFVWGALDRAWWPVWWSWGNGRMPLWLGSWRINLPAWAVWFRAFAIIGPSLAWWLSWRFVIWRYRVEIVAPTASSVPVQQARASSVRTPRGAPVRFRDPDEQPPPVIVQRPVKPVPYQSSGTLIHDVLVTESGGEIGRDQLLDMIAVQPQVGFSWRTWRTRGWTRSEWDAAMELLTEMGMVTTPTPGQTTELQVPVDIAEAAVERLI